MSFKLWLKKEAGQEARAYSLEEGLFWGNDSHVISWRFGIFLFRRFFLLALILVDIHYLNVVFPARILNEVLVLRVSSALLLSACWGWLEPVREKQRELWLKKKNAEFEKVLEGSLVRATFFGSLILAGVILWLTERSYHNAWVLNFLYTYLGVIVARFAFDLVSRTLYSGIYAIHRVYRPFWIYPLIESIATLYMIAFWSRIGPWALINAQAGMAVANLATMIWFSKKAATQMRFSLRLNIKKNLPHLFSKPVSITCFGMAIAYAAMQSEHWLVFLFLKSPFFTRSLYTLGPLLSGPQGWTQMFQFDLTRFRRASRTSLQIRLKKVLEKWSWIIPIVLSITLFITCKVFTRLSSLFAMAGLALIIFGRSHISFRQMSQFVSGKYWRVISLAALFVAGIYLLKLFPIDPAAALGCAGLWMMLLAFASDFVFRKNDFRSKENYLPRSQWLKWVAEQKKPVQIASIKILRIPHTQRSFRTYLESLDASIPLHTKITRKSQDRFWVASVDPAAEFSVEKFWQLFHGMISSAHIIKGENGLLALKSIASTEELGLVTRDHAAPKELEQLLIENPGAQTFKVGEPKLNQWASATLSRDQRNLIFKDALKQMDEDPGKARIFSQRLWNVFLILKNEGSMPELIFIPVREDEDAEIKRNRILDFKKIQTLALSKFAKIDLT